MPLFTNQMRFTGTSGIDVNDMVSQMMRAHAVRLDRMRQGRDVLRWQQQQMRDLTRDHIQTMQRRFLDFANPVQTNNIRRVANFRGLEATLNGATNGSIPGVTVTPSGNGLSPGTQESISVRSVAQGSIYRSTGAASAAWRNQPITADNALDIDNFVSNGMRFSLNFNNSSITFNVNPGNWLNEAARTERDDARTALNTQRAANPGLPWAALDTAHTARNTARSNFERDDAAWIAAGRPTSGALYNNRNNTYAALNTAQSALDTAISALDNPAAEAAFNDFLAADDALRGNQTREVAELNAARSSYNAITTAQRNVLNLYNARPDGQTRDAFRAGLTTAQQSAFDVAISRFDRYEAAQEAYEDAVLGMFDDGGGSLDEAAIRERILTEINSRLHSQFGSAPSSNAESFPDGSIPGTGNGRQNVWVDFDANGALEFRARDGHNVSIAGSLEDMGFEIPAGTEDSPIFNNLTPTHTFLGEFMDINDFDFTINGINFMLTENGLWVGPGEAGEVGRGSWVLGGAAGTDAGNAFNPETVTVQQVMNAVNNNAAANVRMSFSPSTRSFNLESRGIGYHNGSIDFGASGQTGFLTMLGLENTQEASDAEIVVGGQTMFRDSNNFVINGMEIRIDPTRLEQTVREDGRLVDESGADASLTLDITLVRDTEPIMEMITEFIEGYNALIRSIRDLTETRRPRPSGGGFYMPLTEEQRRGMSDREIEMWEEQAQTGLLHRDPTLRRLLEDLHRNVFHNVSLGDGREINLLHLGIRTSPNREDFGLLVINDPERLQYMIENRLDDVTTLFTQSRGATPGTGTRGPERSEWLREVGIGERINGLITWQTTYGGGIFSRSGLHTGESINNNAISRRIAEQERRMDREIEVLQRRENRYFQIFGRMETAMMQAHSQMMFLEQLMWMG